MPERIESSAPGKIVLWGEYAVLAGVPAAVLAVNRHVICTVRTSSSGYSLSSAGFDMLPVVSRSLQPGALPAAARLFGCAASAVKATLPDGLDIRIDSSAFHHQGHKLGIGSSAAALVACYGALARVAGEDFDLAAAITAHREFQGSGSGLDVAAAFHGGCIQYQSGTARPLELPASLVYRFIFSGESASTGQKLGSFSAWRERGNAVPLDMLALACHALFEHADDPHAWYRYIDALRHLDLSAGLGIFSTSHNVLGEIADELGLLYKPCGAGGGDVGMVIAFDHDGSADRLDAFCTRAQQRGFILLDIAGTPDGLQFRS